MNTYRLKSLLAGGLAMATMGLGAQETAPPTRLAPDLSIYEPASVEPLSESSEEVLPIDPPPLPRQGLTQAPAIPLGNPPQNLIGEDGKVELDLIDPFQRGSAKAMEEEDENGLSSTSLGEISEEFRILAIVIPEGESRQPMALIRLQNESTPQVVTKDDLVQIKRRSPDRVAPIRVNTTGSAPGQPSFEESALSALDSYSFYLHIKDIKPTYIEAYQKKSPNETIILRW